MSEILFKTVKPQHSNDEIYDSRTPDWDCRCFYPCEIFLTRIPVSALGKYKNEQPHTGCRSIREVVMLK